MTPDVLFPILAFLGVHTGALLWWGASLNAAVKHHDRMLLDHEERLREGKL